MKRILVIVLVLLGFMTVNSYAEISGDMNNVKVTASVDVGDNITKLTEKLAETIGVTADKIYPHYVKQIAIEGYSFFFVLFLYGILLIVILAISLQRADWENGNFYAFITAISSFFLVVSLIFISAEIPENITKILNPEYHAVHQIVKDISYLLH